MENFSFEFAAQKTNFQLQKWDEIWQKTQDSFYCSWGLQQETISSLQKKWGFEFTWEEKK